jgi:membrane protein DedA with SNARE-associated domain
VAVSDAVPLDARAEPEHPRWLLPLIGAGITALIVATNVGNAVWASWISQRPYGLLALNSSNKYLVGTTPNTVLWTVLVVSTIRLMAPDPLFYALGYMYRDRALHWARRVFPASGQLFDNFEQDRSGFTRVLDVLVFVVPNNPVCLLAGAAQMDRRRFLLLSFAGTIGRILLMRGIGMLFEDQIESLLDVVADYQRWLTLASVALVLLYVLWQARSHRGLVGGIEDLEEELGD